jgi:hypothetical protein
MSNLGKVPTDALAACLAGGKLSDEVVARQLRELSATEAAMRKYWDKDGGGGRKGKRGKGPATVFEEKVRAALEKRERQNRGEDTKDRPEVSAADA